MQAQKMSNSMKVSVSILSANFASLKDEVIFLEKSGADLLHIDVMDGLFVNNITFGPKLIKDIRKYSNLLFDTHLMIQNPILYIKQFAEAGSDMISFHLESSSNILDTIYEIKKYNKKAGIAINPETVITNDFIQIIKNIDFILVMSVNPGFGGQKFLECQIEKILTLQSIIKEHNLNIQISVDGGVTNQNATKLKEIGIDIAVSGSYIFSSGADFYKQKIDSLR